MVEQTNPETPESKEIKTKELTNEDYEKILKDILTKQEYKAEARYFLILEEVRDYGGGYDYAEFSIVRGKAEVIELEEYEAFNEVHRKYLIIPLSIPVIIQYDEGGADYGTTYIYVFTADGWKSVKV